MQAADLASWIDAYAGGFGKEWGPAFAPTGYLLVAKDGVPIVSRAYGTANPKTGAAIGPSTQFQLGSVTKQFTAVAVLQLAEKKRVNLTDSIRTYVAGLPPEFDAVTLHHLLTHTSGIANYTEDGELMATKDERLPRARVVASFAAKPLAFRPGEKFEYSNSNYFLLGLVIEKASGKTYEEYLQANILGPANMPRSSTTFDAHTFDAAAGTSVDDYEKVSAVHGWDTPLPFAAGALRSTPIDMLAWDRALTFRKAMAARSPQSRAMFARRGLATHAPLDRTTHAMLLRQLYLSLYEARRFAQAHTIALQALELDVLSDVLNQDAARAALGNGDLESALSHLRAAARRGPASRRPFHLWTLGSAPVPRRAPRGSGRRALPGCALGNAGQAALPRAPGAREDRGRRAHRRPGSPGHDQPARGGAVRPRLRAVRPRPSRLRRRRVEGRKALPRSLSQANDRVAPRARDRARGRGADDPRDARENERELTPAAWRPRTGGTEAIVSQVGSSEGGLRGVCLARKRPSSGEKSATNRGEISWLFGRDRKKISDSPSRSAAC